MRQAVKQMIVMMYATIITGLFVGAIIQVSEARKKETELIDQLLDCEAEGAKQFDEIMQLQTDNQILGSCCANQGLQSDG